MVEREGHTGRGSGPSSGGWLRARSWSPYAVGAGLGVLSWFAFATADHGLGITTAFEYTAALIEKPFLAGDHAYLLEESKRPKIDWEWMLVLGVFMGAFVSSRLSGDRDTGTVPELWRQRFGEGAGKRLAAAFGGGFLMMVGARLAQGCTSGHGITGAMQLAVSSWIFLIAFFAVGAVVALTMYGTKGASRVR